MLACSDIPAARWQEGRRDKHLLREAGGRGHRALRGRADRRVQMREARQLTRREQFILACHSHGACVSFLAVLDGVQLGLGIIDTPALLSLLWGPLAGWSAGRHFSVRWLAAYGLFYLLKVAYSV